MRLMTQSGSAAVFELVFFCSGKGQKPQMKAYVLDGLIAR